MIYSRLSYLQTGVGLIALCAAWGAGCAHRPERSGNSGKAAVSITTTNYRGWPDSYVLRNATAEVVVVPRLGRIMQFGFRGEEGVFWENQRLEGKALQCDIVEWMNFGGDKTWPAPEGDWSKITAKSYWHPPPAFDCMPLSAELIGHDLALTSPIDPFYGIRVRRIVRLDPRQPVLTVETTYERVSGEPLSVSIWTITQLKDPDAVFAPLNELREPVLLGKDRPPTLQTLEGLASLRRNPQGPYKIGLRSSELLWTGKKDALLISSPRSAAEAYPDRGSSSEIYTNPDPLQYVELEMLGPLQTLKVGQTMSHTNRYELFRRTHTLATAEAKQILGSAAHSKRN